MSKLSLEGWAERIECYIDGIEIANGYQELDNKEDLVTIWKLNNNLREMLGYPPHPIDFFLVEVSDRMKNVAGMAVGFERSLMAIFGIEDIKEFSFI